MSLASAKEFLRQDKNPEALKAAQDAIPKLKSKELAEGISIAVDAALELGDKDAAAKLVSEAAASNDKTLKAALFQCGAKVSLAKGEYDNALESAQQSEKLCDEIGDASSRGGAMLLFAAVHTKRDEHKLALSKALQAVDFYTKAGNKAGEAEAWLEVMKVRLTLGKYQDAMKSAEAALVIFINLDDSIGKAKMLCSAADAHFANEQPQKALKAAGMALDLFRKQNLRMRETTALDLQVQALIGIGSKDEALRAAKTGVALLQKSGDRMATALGMMAIVHAYSGKGENRSALDAARDALAILRELGNKKLMATMMIEVAKLHAAVGEGEKASELAEEAVRLCRECGDWMGLAAATEVIGAVEDSAATLALQEEQNEEKKILLNKLASAFEMRNAPEFKDVLDRIYSSNNISIEEFQDAIAPVMEKDPEGAQVWAESNHPDSYPLEQESEERDVDMLGKNLDSKVATQFDRRFCYFAFRWGGMGYGPGFRLLKTAFRKGPQGWTAHGHGTLTIKDDHDDWEEYTGYHPGIYDCALQAGAPRGYDENFVRAQYKPSQPGAWKYTHPGPDQPPHRRNWGFTAVS